MYERSHILELLRGGVADKGDVIGVIDVRACRRDIREIIRERYLTVIACHFNLGLGLFQGLVVLDCHFAALLQRQRLLGIHRNWHKCHSDQC